MSIIQIFRLYPTQKDCIKHLEKARWGNKPRCSYCQSTRTTQHKKEPRHYCNDCQTSFSVTVRTIFHRTHLPLQKWFLAISLILNTDKKLPAVQLSRDLEVNKNTAGRIAIQIRRAMRQRESRELLISIIEMSESCKDSKSRKENDNDTSRCGSGINKAEKKVKHPQALVKQNIDTVTEGSIADKYTGYRDMDRVLPHSVIKNKNRWCR